MATYQEIQNYVKQKYGCVVKSCWIAHVKELNGLNPRLSPNRRSPQQRLYPCPTDKRLLIEEAFKHYKML